ncbi:hypothetical protein DM860_007895 [Cuscuta australis]|uniref:Uncharacterized protein n=1 Tax=Cuscuta australis TaxID=267555 RepID=A0A328E197_9ASTE|nr:hypothetical protein DM860_007895 [Cuscuta australis]
MAGDSQAPPKQTPTNPTKYFKHFMFKPLLITVFLVSLLLLPPQAPEFLSQSLGSTIWEILQLVFVGIAVSYGLFSWKSDYPDKENGGEAKFENAHSFVSGLLQVSSVFDDDGGGGGGGSGGFSVMDEKIDGNCRNIVQTWSNQCRRGGPMAVSGVEEQRGCFSVTREISRIGEKPLLLPVRSLKSRIEDGEGKMERKGSVNKEEQEEEDVNPVLPSPIPWRSRSGRFIQMKQDSEPLPEPELADEPGDDERGSRDGSRDDDDDDDHHHHESGAEDDYSDDGDHSSGDEDDDDEGRDVDKKAAEFIAKIKEQIRMQRIDSIKKSA